MRKYRKFTEEHFLLKRLLWGMGGGINQRKRTIFYLVVSLAFLTAVTIGGLCCGEAAQVTDFSRKNLPPCLPYIFGTDWLGRDMFVRTIKGLSLSIIIGLFAAAVSAVIALLLGMAAAALGKKADAVICFIIDLVMGIPHLLLILLICVAVGRGLSGVIIGVAVTHWCSLARVVRGEVLQLKQSRYVQIAGKLGHGRLHIAAKHMLPHVLPQFIVGLILLFPHAVLHEASITFLGFGLSSEQPAIGIILSESMKYLVIGEWWLAFFPGLMLVITVVLFSVLGESIRKLLDPSSVHE